MTTMNELITDSTTVTYAFNSVLNHNLVLKTTSALHKWQTFCNIPSNKIGEFLDMIEFERTKKLAKIRKMSLREVNDKAKLGTNTIYNWKSKKPGSDALAAVAKVLNTTTDYLKGLTDDHNPSSKDKFQADLDDDDTIFTFQGKPIPPEDLKIIRRLLKNDDE